MEIKINKDTTLNVDVAGKGELVVLLPAIARSSKDFKLQADCLVKSGYKTAAINHRGINGSTGRTENLTLKHMAMDTIQVIEALGGEPAHVLGHCSGGRICRILADKRPDLVKSTLLLTAGGLVPAQCDFFPVWELITDRDPQDLERQEKIKLFFSQYSDPSSWYTGWTASQVKKHVLAFISSPAEEWLEGGRAPMLIIQGEDDLVAPIENGRKLVRRIGKRARVVDIPKAGHQILNEQPEFLAKTVLAFLEDIKGREPSVTTFGKQKAAEPEPYFLGWGPAVTRYQKERKATRFAEFFVRHLKSGMRIIDCGCGPGTMTADFAEMVAPGDILGIDINPEQIEYAKSLASARQIKNITFEVKDIYNLPYEDYSFDAAWLCTVLMNIGEPESALKEIHRILKPGGFIGVSDGDWGGDVMVPQYQTINDLNAYFEKQMKKTGADYRRGRYHRSMLSKTGFKNIQSSAMVEYYGTEEETKYWADMCIQRIEDSFQGDSFLKQCCIRAYKAWGEHPDSFFARLRCQAVAWKN